MPELGFRLARSMGMEGSTGNLHDYPVDTGNSTAIFRGDLVTLNGGYVEKSAGGAGAAILGVFFGCRFTDANGDVRFERYWDGGSGRTDIQAQISVVGPASTLLVAVDPTEVYTAADVGVKKAAAAGAGGNALTGRSSQILGAAGATVATAPLVPLKFFDKNMSDIIPAAAGDATWAEVAVAKDNAILAVGP